MSGGGTVVGLVGYGRWGRHVLRDLRTLGCTVHVADPDPAARAAAVRAGAVSAVPGAEALPPCAGFVVATPASTHAAAVRDLLDRGRPVFVEKPFTTDAADAADLAVAGAGRLFVMEKWRYHPAVALLRELVSSGALGAPVEVRTRRWAERRSQSDVGADWTLAPHDVSVLDELVGPLGPVQHARAVGRGGRTERLTATVAAACPASFDVWDAAPTSERSIEVRGRAGTATWYSSDESVVVVEEAGGGPPDRRPVGPAELPLLAELRELVDHLGCGPPPRATAEDGARTVALVAAAVALAQVDA